MFLIALPKYTASQSTKQITFAVIAVTNSYLITQAPSLVMYFQNAANPQTLILIHVHRQRDRHHFHIRRSRLPVFFKDHLMTNRRASLYRTRLYTFCKNVRVCMYQWAQVNREVFYGLALAIAKHIAPQLYIHIYKQTYRLLRGSRTRCYITAT